MAQFAVPPMINCQGILTDNAGTLLSSPVQVVFAIWDDVASGDSLWSEAQEISPDHLGRFDALLGSISPIPDSAFGEAAFLSFQVVGFPESVPRQQLVSTAYAYKAARANEAAVAAPGSVGSAAIIDGSIGLQDIGDNGATEGQVIKRGPDGWIVGDDLTGGEPVPDEDWVSSSDVLYTVGQWGIARSGNVLFGDNDSTHVNLGVACTTGTNGINQRYATVCGGLANVAGGTCSAVMGGRANAARGDYSFAAGYRAKAEHFGSFVWGDGTDGDFVSSDNNQFLIRAAGGVGIGTNTPLSGYQLHVNGPAWFDVDGGSIAMSAPDGWPGLIMLSPGHKRRDLIIKDNSLQLITSNSNAAPEAGNGITILNDGSVGIGTDAPNFTLDVRGTIGSNSTLYHSDRRWKKNIETIPGALNKVTALRGVDFEWRCADFPEMGFPDGKHLGLVAQDVEAVLPEVVQTGTDGHKSIEYVSLVALLVEAVKEQQKEILQLELQISEMRSIIGQSHPDASGK